MNNMVFWCSHGATSWLIMVLQLPVKMSIVYKSDNIEIMQIHWCKNSLLSQFKAILLMHKFLVLLMQVVEPFPAVTTIFNSVWQSAINGQVLNLKQIHTKEAEIIHWWKSVRFKKDSFIQHRESEWSKRWRVTWVRRGWSRLLLNSADGLDLRGLAVGTKLLEVFELPTVTITLHDILVSTVTRILVAHKSVEK